MQSLIHTVSFKGIETVTVSVQVHISNGLPAMAIVGLADKAVAESKERVRAALSSLGLSLPAKRIAVNLAPADLVKEGAHFDLPIALGLMTAMGVLPADSVDDYLVLGELSLDGSIQPITGTLPAALAAATQQKRIICPAANGPEAGWAGELDVVAASSLTQLINHLRGTQVIAAPERRLLPKSPPGPDMADLKGQQTARRVLEIAAAGGHHLLMIGPPGAGKSMLAARLPSLLPELTPAEALETTMIHSITGTVPVSGLVQNRPFLDPRHSASMAALVGGGNKAWPGEISMAHNGVLFLDELAEFSRQALDSLRQPLETGEIVIARANMHVRYPAKFQLVAAMNPCRCGYLSDPARACTKAPDCARNYMAKVSGPMLDRFDLLLDIEALEPSALMTDSPAETSDEIKTRIAAARSFAVQQRPHTATHLNAKLSAADIQKDIQLNDHVQAVLTQAMDKQNLSARGFHKILRVARTIADLARSEQIDRIHVLEALSYRRYFLFGAVNG